MKIKEEHLAMILGAAFVLAIGYYKINPPPERIREVKVTAADRIYTASNPPPSTRWWTPRRDMSECFESQPPQAVADDLYQRFGYRTKTRKAWEYEGRVDVEWTMDDGRTFSQNLYPTRHDCEHNQGIRR